MFGAEQTTNGQVKLNIHVEVMETGVLSHIRKSL